jgi:hypothetical protein
MGDQLDDQLDDIATLLEIEAIKRLKARYCRYLDAKDWAAWRGIFADEFVGFTHHSLRSQATVHQVHAPDIELTSPTTARGVWALEDVVRFGPGVNLRGYGHYQETNRKVDGDWRIASSKLTRLREDVFNIAVSVYISKRIRRVLMRAAGRVMK